MQTLGVAVIPMEIITANETEILLVITYIIFLISETSMYEL